MGFPLIFILGLELETFTVRADGNATNVVDLHRKRVLRPVPFGNKVMRLTVTCRADNGEIGPLDVRRDGSGFASCLICNSHIPNR